jgi:signal transduction histidine kinase/CheY-like chemotaxis protein
MRIRSRLLLLMSAVLVPALIVAALAIGYLYGEERAFNRASMSETARALALVLDNEMARREAMLRTLGHSRSLERGDLATFYGFAAAVAEEEGSAIILSDLEGRQLVNTRIPYGAPLPRMLPAERENRARLGNEVTVVSDVYVPPANLGPQSFAIQMPVRQDGKVVAFLTMASYAAQMQKLLAAQPLPQGWHATIVDSQGVVVARSLEPEKFVGTPVRAELAAKLKASAEGYREGTTLGGVPGTVFFSRAPRSKWVFLVTVPQALLYGPPVRTAVLLGAGMLLLLMLGAAAALSAARRIARPVEALREAAERLGHNEPVTPRALGTDELDAVSAAMAQASERLRGTTAELERRVAAAVASFEDSQRALVQSQKLEALGRLTGGIAHDFNNVLQTLTAGLGTLARDAPEERRKLLARCERAVARGTELARQLMAFGRVQELRAQTIDAGARLRDARALFKGALPANVRLDYAIEPGLAPVAVDPAQLELAILNLVINARDAMPQGGRIVIAAKNEGDRVAISVIDDGEGMSEEVKARALEPFYTTKGVGKGSGMGLPQAYGFAQQHGGTLTLESQRGEGTTVKLFLPRARDAIAEEPTPALERRAKGVGKVLLVEDDAEVRDTVATALRATGFEIHTANMADEALERLVAGEHYDVVLTDVVMPGVLNGVDLAREVKRRYPRTAVVMATGYSDRAVHVAGVQALPKPYNLDQVVEALNAAMRLQQL